MVSYGGGSSVNNSFKKYKCVCVSVKMQTEALYRERQLVLIYFIDSVQILIYRITILTARFLRKILVQIYARSFFTIKKKFMPVFSIQ